MDMRETVVDQQSFLYMLQTLKEENKKVFLLYDEQGLTRAEGFITAFMPVDERAAVMLDNGMTIPVRSIVAVNGIFLSDYSTC